MTNINIHIERHTRPVELAESGGLMLVPCWTVSRDARASVIFDTADEAVAAVDRLAQRAAELGRQVTMVRQA